MKTSLFCTYIGALVAICSFHHQAEAAIIATFQQSGSDVALNASGSVDLTGLAVEYLNGGGNQGAWFGQLNAYGSYQGLWDAYSGGTTSVSGTWPATGTVAGTGDSLGVQGIYLSMPAGYVTNDDINLHYSGFTISNATLTGLGLSPGASAIYSWDSGANGIQSITISVGPIPEPSTAVTLVAAAALFLVLRKKRR